MEIIQGTFGKEKPPEFKTLREVFEHPDYTSVLDEPLDTFLGFLDSGKGTVLTICYPHMSQVEIMGAMEVYKFGLIISGASEGGE